MWKYIQMDKSQILLLNLNAISESSLIMSVRFCKVNKILSSNHNFFKED